MIFQDSSLLQCRGCSKEMANISMQDNRVIDIINLVGLEGLFRALSREIDHGLKMSITLQDMEVILGLPKDGEVLVNFY